MIPVWIYSSWKYAPLVVGAHESVKRHLWTDAGVIGWKWGGADYDAVEVDTDWCAGLHDFLDRCKSEHIVLLLEDYYLTYVDRTMYARCEKLMRQDDDIAKIDLSGSVAEFQHTKYKRGLLRARKDAQYRSSLQAAMWRTDYLKSLCPKRGSAWTFEVEGAIKAMDDGALVLGVAKPCVRYLNLMRKGCWYGKDDYEGR